MKAGIDGFLLDMDGVLYHGERPLPHAAEFMAVIRHYPHCFITNNPTRTPEQVAQKLRRLGIADPSPDRIVTSAQATAQWLARRRPGFRFFAVGMPALHAALSEHGSEDSLRPQYVVVGEGSLDYEALVTGIGHVLAGAELIGTNPDSSVDGSRGGCHVVLPGGGALIAPFAVATGVEPRFIGKPEAPLYRMALDRLGLVPARCLMIGDRPDTDILGAQRLGMKTALVRTGRFCPGAALPTSVREPDYDVADLAALLERLGGS